MSTFVEGKSKIRVEWESKNSGCITGRNVYVGHLHRTTKTGVRADLLNEKPGKTDQFDILLRETTSGAEFKVPFVYDYDTWGAMKVVRSGKTALLSYEDEYAAITISLS